MIHGAKKLLYFLFLQIGFSTFNPTRSAATPPDAWVGNAFTSSFRFALSLWNGSHRPQQMVWNSQIDFPLHATTSKTKTNKQKKKTILIKTFCFDCKQKLIKNSKWKQKKKAKHWKNDCEIEIWEKKGPTAWPWLPRPPLPLPLKLLHQCQIHDCNCPTPPPWRLLPLTDCLWYRYFCQMFKPNVKVRVKRSWLGVKASGMTDSSTTATHSSCGR